jgi:hypothetical protein
MTSWLGTIGGLIGIAVFLGAVVVYLRGSRDKGTIQTLERSNHALTERVDILERDLRDAEQRAQSDHERIELLERENVRLLSQRPSADVLAEVSVDLKELARLNREHDVEIRALLMAAINDFGEMKLAMGDVAARLGEAQ